MHAHTQEAIGGKVPVQWQDAASLKRAQREGEEPSAKRAKTEEGAAVQGVRVLLFVGCRWFAHLSE